MWLCKSSLWADVLLNINRTTNTNEMLNLFFLTRECYTLEHAKNISISLTKFCEIPHIFTFTLLIHIEYICFSFQLIFLTCCVSVNINEIIHWIMWYLTKFFECHCAPAAYIIPCFSLTAQSSRVSESRKKHVYYSHLLHIFANFIFFNLFLRIFIHK